MSDTYIGWWAVRPGGVWHLVESEVTDRSVMRCGRQLELVGKRGVLSFELDPTGDRCQQCAGHWRA